MAVTACRRYRPRRHRALHPRGIGRFGLSPAVGQTTGGTKRNARRAGGRFVVQEPGEPGQGSLDRAATCSRAPGDHPDHEDGDDRADRRDDDRADVERAVDRMAVEQDAGQEATDECADDPEHDVPDDTESLVTCDEQTGEIPGDRAEDDPCDDTHTLTSVPIAGLSPACWG